MDDEQLAHAHTHSPGTGLVARKSRLREALKFAATLPRLDSLDLSAWDTLSDSVTPPRVWVLAIARR